MLTTVSIKISDIYVPSDRRKEIDPVKADDFALLAHHREVSIGLAFLGLYLDKSSHGCHFNYHCLLSSGMFLSVAHPLRYQ